jgi:hypothetical protein
MHKYSLARARVRSPTVGTENYGVCCYLFYAGFFGFSLFLLKVGGSFPGCENSLESRHETSACGQISMIESTCFDDHILNSDS